MAKTTKPAATRRAKAEHPGTGHTCGQCSRGAYDDKFINKDVHGRPFVILCEHSNYSTNSHGERVTLRGCKACENFKEGER